LTEPAIVRDDEYNRDTKSNDLDGDWERQYADEFQESVALKGIYRYEPDEENPVDNPWRKGPNGG
jgi:hypothetical protein